MSLISRAVVFMPNNSKFLRSYDSNSWLLEEHQSILQWLYLLARYAPKYKCILAYIVFALSFVACFVVFSLTSNSGRPSKCLKVCYCPTHVDEFTFSILPYILTYKRSIKNSFQDWGQGGFQTDSNDKNLHKLIVFMFKTAVLLKSAASSVKNLYSKIRFLHHLIAISKILATELDAQQGSRVLKRCHTAYWQ